MAADVSVFNAFSSGVSRVITIIEILSKELNLKASFDAQVSLTYRDCITDLRSARDKLLKASITIDDAYLRVYRCITMSVIEEMKQDEGLSKFLKEVNKAGEAWEQQRIDYCLRGTGPNHHSRGLA